MFEVFPSITDTFLEPVYGDFEGGMKGLESWVMVPDYLELRLSDIKNPVTGEVEKVMSENAGPLGLEKVQVAPSSSRMSDPGMPRRIDIKSGGVGNFVWSGD